MIFLNSAYSAAALVFYLPALCTQTDTEGKQSSEYIEKFGKKTIFNEHPVCIQSFMVRGWTRGACIHGSGRLAGIHGSGMFAVIHGSGMFAGSGMLMAGINRLGRLSGIQG